MLAKLALVVLSFFLILLSILPLLPIVYANEIKVSYFFGGQCEFSRMEEANIEKVRSYWSGKVDWKDYDLDNSSNTYLEKEYGIVGVPVAVIECSDKTIKIDRKDSSFSQEVNQTIYECQSGQSKNLNANLPIEKHVILLLFILGFVLWGYLIHKKVVHKKLRSKGRKRGRRKK